MNWLSSLINKRNISEKWANTPISQLPLLAIDLELTSLDSKIAHVTAVGWIQGRLGQCNVASANYDVVRTSQSLQQSPAVHGLTREKVLQGVSVNQVLQRLLPLLKNSVCVFHHAKLDVSVSRRICSELELDWPEVTYIDTLEMQRYLLNKQGGVLKQNSLALNQSREYFGLPHSNIHNPLDDALATLELLYAQLSELNVFDCSLSSIKHTGSLSVTLTHKTV